MHKDGYAKFTAKYDERGNQTEGIYFGVDGKPCLSKDGYAKRAMDYDENGNWLRTHLFDVEGNELSGVIIVNSVLSDSQAERMGLQEEDMFVEYDGKFFDDFAELINYRKLETGGEPRELIVLRGEDLLRFEVQPGQMGAELGTRVLPQATIEQIKENVQQFKKVESNEPEVDEPQIEDIVDIMELMPNDAKNE